MCSSLASESSNASSSFLAAAVSSSAKFRYFRRLFLVALALFFSLTCAIIALRLASPFRRSSILWARSSRAILRFWVRERVACDLTTMPVGRWMSWTAELVLFYFCGVLATELARLPRGRRGGESGATYDFLPAGSGAFEKGLFNFQLGRRFGTGGKLLSEGGCRRERKPGLDG